MAGRRIDVVIITQFRAPKLLEPTRSATSCVNHTVSRSSYALSLNLAKSVANNSESFCGESISFIHLQFPLPLHSTVKTLRGFHLCVRIRQGPLVLASSDIPHCPLWFHPLWCVGFQANFHTDLALPTVAAPSDSICFHPPKSTTKTPNPTRSGFWFHDVEQHVLQTPILGASAPQRSVVVEVMTVLLPQKNTKNPFPVLQ